MKFYIGKYDGQMVDDIYEKDINYCNWFVKANPNSKTSTYILNKNNPMKEASDYVFWFGKHRTRSIRAVLKEDMEYCKWFVETYPTKKETLFIIKTKIYNKYINKPN
jgi:uncharacterized protein (DUF3820 family)